MVTLYTTAPEAYDYGYVERTPEPIGEMVSLRGAQPIYRVRMPEEHVDYQCGRYGSGLHPSLDESELTEWDTHGFLKLYPAD